MLETVPHARVTKPYAFASSSVASGTSMIRIQLTVVPPRMDVKTETPGVVSRLHRRNRASRIGSVRIERVVQLMKRMNTSNHDEDESMLNDVGVTPMDNLYSFRIGERPIAVPHSAFENGALFDHGELEGKVIFL